MFGLLRRRVDPAALITAERPVGVVVGDDVLAQLGADGLEQVPQVADDREVAQDRVASLRQVVDAHRARPSTIRTSTHSHQRIRVMLAASGERSSTRLGGGVSRVEAAGGELRLDLVLAGDVLLVELLGRADDRRRP